MLRLIVLAALALSGCGASIDGGICGDFMPMPTTEQLDDPWLPEGQVKFVQGYNAAVDDCNVRRVVTPN